MSGDKNRVFIAINLPSDVKQELATYISQLKHLNSKRSLIYVKPEILHLTLHFLGNLDYEEIEQIKSIISESIRNKNSFQMSLGDIGGFPSIEFPRIIYLECRDGGNALKLQKEIGKKLSDSGFAIDNRSWKSHLTICRIKNSEKFYIDDKIIIPQLTFEVRSIDLMQSKLTPPGPEYSVIESFKLK
ncbi:RNA 2',3'-cyclic phosphodiesterase [Candidatus Parcubacteria bacterium]|nr:MAG: RNA 2',3'-cyclic phosphodiesterase [Candidatus Parcubacteria bacterium]